MSSSLSQPTATGDRVGRPLPFGAHAVFDIAVGLVAMLAPFVFDLAVSAGVFSVLAGVLLVGLGLSAVSAGDRRGTVPIPTHAALDRIILVGLIAATLAFAVGGRADEAALFAALALAQALLGQLTRYSHQ